MRPLRCTSALLLLAALAVLPASAQSWSGFYAGIHGGAAKASGGTAVEGRLAGDPTLIPYGFVDGRNTSLDRSDTAPLFGGHVGYNWHNGAALFGVEGDVSGTDLKTSMTEPIHYLDGSVVAGGVASTTQKVKLLATARCRVGYTPSDRWLVYLTGGLAYAQVEYDSDMDYRNVPGYGFHLPASYHGHAMGPVIGAGVEMAMGSRLSARLDYLYYNLNKRTEVGSATPVTLTNDFQYTWEETIQVLRAGVSFRF